MLRPDAPLVRGRGGSCTLSTPRRPPPRTRPPPRRRRPGTAGTPRLWAKRDGEVSKSLKGGGVEGCAVEAEAVRTKVVHVRLGLGELHLVHALAGVPAHFLTCKRPRLPLAVNIS